MRTLAHKHLARGRTLVSCKICGEKIIGHVFWSDFQNDTMSALQRFQLHNMMWLAKKGCEAVKCKLDTKDKHEQFSTFLTTHFTRRAKNKEHRDVLKELLKQKEGDDRLSPHLRIDSEVAEWMANR